MTDDATPMTGEEIEVVSPQTLAIQTRAEIDVQIATAHAYPRSVKNFLNAARSLATLDEETAISCFYRLPRGGKPIEGPSIRLAEIVGSAWGNLRYGARVVDQDRQFITAEGVCHDLERNVSATVRVQRRITGKDGRTFNADMIGVTANAACSIALRNAIFRVVPFAYVKPVYDAAVKTARGQADSLADKRHKVVDYFKKLGVDEARLCAACGKAGLTDLDLDDVFHLRQVASSVKNGEATIDEAFPPPEEPKAPEPPSKSGTEKLAEKLKGRGKAKDTPPAPADADAKPANGNGVGRTGKPAEYWPGEGNGDAYEGPPAEPITNQ